MSFEKSNPINFGNQKKCHLRNQTPATNFGIKRVKFWKSKMHLRNQTRQTLEIKIVIREIKRDKFKINMTQQKPKGCQFPFNHRQDTKIIEDKKRIRHSKFYL